MFKHFVLTRFNLVFRSENFQKDKSGALTQTVAWLDNRFDLFNRICYPSMINQTNKNFSWFVLFSEHTPLKYRKIIDTYKEKFENFIPVFMMDGEDHDGQIKLESIKEKMLNYMDDGDQYVITSRLDSDDAYHECMVQRIQEEFKQQDDIFLSFDIGLQYEREQRLLSVIYFQRNAFISRIEKVTNKSFETVLSTKHTQADKVAPVKYIRTQPLWLMLIHEGNLYNWFRTANILGSAKITKGFHLSPAIKVSVRNFYKWKFKTAIQKLRRRRRV